MKKMKILLVDDEEAVLEVIGMRIRGWGYDLVTAPDGRKGLKALKAEKPDMVILDYMMPGLDGVETLREIRKVDKRIPVAIFTAYPDQKSVKGSEELGVSAYIPKLSAYSDSPTALKTVLNMIEKKLEQKTEE